MSDTTEALLQTIAAGLRCRKSKGTDVVRAVRLVNDTHNGKQRRVVMLDLDDRFRTQSWNGQSSNRHLAYGIAVVEDDLVCRALVGPDHLAAAKMPLVAVPLANPACLQAFAAGLRSIGIYAEFEVRP